MFNTCWKDDGNVFETSDYNAKKRMSDTIERFKAERSGNRTLLLLLGGASAD